MYKGPGVLLLQPGMKNKTTILGHPYSSRKDPKTMSTALSTPSPLPSLFPLLPLTAELNLR